MSAFLQLTLALAIIVLAAKAGGYMAVRLRQPAVLGELLAGLILGPTVVDLVHLPFVSDPELLHEEIWIIGNCRGDQHIWRSRQANNR